MEKEQSRQALYLWIFLLLAGILFHGTILFLPHGFNADAATEALRALDSLQGRGGLSFLDFHGYRVYLLPLAPLWLPQWIVGPTVFPIRALMLIYNLLGVWALYSLSRRWFGDVTSRFVLILGLFLPWLAEPFSVTVATAATLPTLAIALSKSKRGWRVLLGHALLGGSFYAYHTARLGAILYLLISFVVRRKELKARAIPLLMAALAIVPSSLLSMRSTSYQKMMLFPGGPQWDQLIPRVQDGLLSWGPGGMACPLLFIIALAGILLLVKDLWHGKGNVLPVLWLLTLGGSLLLAALVAPYFRPRVGLHSAPAILIACGFALAWLHARWTLLARGMAALMVLHGIYVHTWRLTWDGASTRGGWDYGIVEVFPELLRLDPDWIHVDCRMDDQLLYLSDRTFPLDDAVFPRTGGATFPWLGYELHDGTSIYLLWADSGEKANFLQVFPGALPRQVISSAGGARALEMYVVDRQWTPQERLQIRKVSELCLWQEGDFWFDEGDLHKASSLYSLLWERYSESPRAPEAGLRAGTALIELGRLEEGILLLQRIAADYPESEKGKVCGELLTSLGQSP